MTSIVRSEKSSSEAVLNGWPPEVRFDILAGRRELVEHLFGTIQ
jgi:hypothetical protein